MSRPTSSDPFIYIITGPAQSDGQLQAQIVRFSLGEHNASGMYVLPPCVLFFFKLLIQ